MQGQRNLKMQPKGHQPSALVFDLDDTLYQRRDPYLAAFHACFGERPEIPEDALFRKSRLIGNEEYERRIRGEIDMRQMEIARTARTLALFGITVSDEEALTFERTYAAFLEKVRLRPAMIQILDLAKSQGRVLGILTNGPTARQLRKIEALGLSRWFSRDHILISQEAGASKPDPAIFRMMETRCGLDPAGTVLVGDGEETDILGAKAAGWRAVLLVQPFLPQNPADTAADLVAVEEAGLLALLQAEKI